MTDEGQTGLADFGPGGDDGADDADRPEEEAVYVAGDEGDAEVVDPTTATLPDAEGTVEMTVTQVDYTVAGYGDEEEPLMHVFGRRADRTGEHVVVRGFEPYFYAPTDTVDEENLATRDRVTGYEEGYESIRGEELTKVFGQTPRDVGQMRDDFQHYEADVLFPNRFLIDKDIGAGVAVPNRRLEDGRLLVDHEEVEAAEASDVPPRMNVFDIEVDDRSGFPEDGEEPIVCLTSHDSYRDEYVVWLFEAPDGEGAVPDSLDDYDPLDDDADHEVRAFDTEEAMLDAFLDYVEETGPDVLSGWNCLPADSSILMADGSTTEIEDVEIGDRVVGNEDQRTTTATVTNKWQSEKEALEFSLADGTTMEASGEHRVMIGDDERVDWKRGAEIEPGDFVLKPRTLTVEDPAVPALSELIPRSHRRYGEDRTIREFKAELPHGAVTELSEEFDVGKETLYHPQPSTWTPERCERAAREFEVPLPDGGTVYRGSDTELDRRITEHEMYLAGLVLADGSLSTSDGIRFYNTRTELHRQFPGDNALTEDRTGCYKQNVLDYVRLHAFNGLGIPFGDKNEDEVDLSPVYRMPESHIGQFLAGVIDGDGCVSGGRLSVAAQNDSIAEWYSKLFKRIGVYSSEQAGQIFVPTTERSLSRLEAQVVPHMSHSEKVERLRSLDGGTSNRSENIPYALFEADPGTDERRIGEDKHRRGINLKRHESTNSEWEEYVFVRVDDIDQVGTETTYDIETTTHNFVAEDCLVHNCDDFDIPYTLDRLEVLQSAAHDHDLSIDRFSRVDEVWRSGWGGPDVKGRVVFDLLRAYKRTQFSELESYRLDAVGEAELGVGKERYAGDIGDLWEDDPERLLEYNLRDVELCVELDRKQDIVQFWMEVKAFVGCLLEDAPTPGDAVDMYVMHEAHDQFVLPSKGQQEGGEEFEGGAVFEPITGVREMVSVLDLKCFSADTDLLTPDGARQITDVEVGDEVYTLNPETFECEVTEVAETHTYDNQFGELHHLSGNTHDFKVTENHRFLASKARGWDDQTPEDFEFAEYRDLTDTERYAFPQHEPMDGATPETFDLLAEIDGGYVVAYTDEDLRVFRNAVPDDVVDSLELVHGSSEAAGLKQKVGKYLVPIERYREHAEQIEALADQTFLKYGPQHRGTPATFEMENWLELMGWYVTEGSIDEANGRITLHQQDDEGRAAIRSLLERMDVNHSVGPRGINISNRYLVEWFEEHCGKGYAEKRLPEWVFDLDGDLCSTLLETMVDGDGSRTESGLRKFWTKSDDLKDGIVDLAIRAGHKPTVSNQNDGTWYVSIGKRGSFEKATNATVESHDGQVHCVTAADNHVVLAGRNGHFQWVGQSLYPMSMATINASPETKVDPDLYDGQTYRSPNGTHFRKEPDGMMREMIDALLSERERKKEQRNEFDPDSPEYKRYDQQQAAVKRVMNCFTPDTDVLTPEGVVGIADLDVGDEVYSLNPDTLEMERKPVAETHAYPDYDGDLIDIETSKVDLGVTPNHRMLVRKAETNGVSWDEDDYRFVEAGSLDDATNYQLPHDWDGPDGERLDEVDLTKLLDDYEVWANNEVHGHTLASEIGWYPNTVKKNDVDETGYVFSASEFEDHRTYLDEACSSFYVQAEANRKWIPRYYDGDDFLELLAWYVTEGSVYTSETTEFGEKLRGSATTIQLAQDAPTATDGGVAVADESASDHRRIGDLLDRMGFDYYVDGNGYQFTSRLLGEYLEATCGEDSFEKRIPEFVFETNRAQKRAFLDTLIAGDGDRGTNSWRYSTASEALRDDVLRLCAHLGLTASYSEGDGGVYRIYVSERSKNTLRMHRSAERTTAKDGVYCVTVADNHTLLAGRNGTFQFVGQSLYGVSGWEQFRLYDKDAAAAITATGRSVIEFTDEVASEMGYQVAYGDSVTGDRPVVVRDPEGLICVLPIEELFEHGVPLQDDPVEMTADGGSVANDAQPKHRRTLRGWEALSMNDDGDPEWRPIEQAIRHETDKSVVKLQHKFGESTTTRDHSYVVEDDDEFVEAAPQEVTRPHRISGVPAVETIEEIDVYEVLRGYTREYEDGRSVGAENAETKTKRVCTDGEWVWFGHEHHDRQDKTVKVKRHIDLTDEDGAALVRLLAAYVTEGSASTQETTDSRFGASIAESRRDWLEGLQTDYHRLFDGTTASIVESDVRDERTVAYETQAEESTVSYEDRTLNLQMMNELAAVFFREFAGQRSRGKRIPSFVYHFPEELQALFLDVLIEGDGYTDFPRYRDSYCERHFEYETVSRELAAGLSTLLNQRDKRHSLKYREDKESYSIRTCDYYREGRDPVLTEVAHDGYVYDLSVAENENFVDGVGGVVLHNTDSVMLELGQDYSTDEAIDASFDIEEAINASYDDYALEELNAATHRFQIEFEKLYRRFFQAGKKKRYAGHIVWKEGKEVDDVDITGFEYKRSDIAGITKEVQHRVIELLVREGDVEGVKEYVHDTIEEFKQGNLPLDEVGIPGGIGKKLDAYETDTAQVRGAKYANVMLGTNFASGSKPMRLYVESVHPDFWRRMEDERGLNPGGGSREDRIYREFKRDPDVICFEYADQVPAEFDVDWDKMLEKTLKGPIARILEALDVSWDEVETGQEQTGLGNFM